MIREIIDRIWGVNQIIEATMTGRDSWGDRWADKDWAVQIFNEVKGIADDELKFADDEFYWENLEKDIRYKEVESPGYAGRLKKYFERYAPGIYKVYYHTIKKGAFLADLVEDEYITQEEADDYAYLVANAHFKVAKDGRKAYEIILDITDPKVEHETQTPTFDFLCKNIDSRLKKKFLDFCLINNIGLNDTNKVLILKTIVGNNIRERLKANQFQMKGLWLELKQLNVISHAISHDTLNKALRGASKIKPEILNAWDDYLKK